MAGNDSPQATTEDLRWVQGSCIRCNAVDTWCKLYTLLWFYEHREQRATGPELCQYLFQADEGLMRAMLTDLKQAGFLVETDQRFGLSDAPDVIACLEYLHQNFADPQARQRLIERIRALGSDNAERGHGY